MIFLLSSDLSLRYKLDILRCLSAPIGSTVQFRYDKVYVAEDTLKTLTDAKTNFPVEAIVCSVASAGVGVLPMVPVRRVQIAEKPREHGATLSMSLIMREFAVSNQATFGADLHRLANQNTPRRTSEGTDPVGFYCFSAEVPRELQLGNTLALWEKTVINLREQHAYVDEPFFWATLGIEREGERLDANVLHSWPAFLEPITQYRLLIYHFQPRGGPRPNSKMEVTFGTALQSVVPPDTKIDSRYDLKSWRFSTGDNPQRRLTTWLRVRTADAWDLDLELTIRPSYRSWILRSLLTGVLVATPAILALVPQVICIDTKIILGGFGILAGFLAGLASTFKVDRPKPN
jgi:hypothetical protein